MNKDKEKLEHYLRKMIYNHIKEYPGVSFSTLKKVYDLNDSTLRYHLKYLERNEKIELAVGSKHSVGNIYDALDLGRQDRVNFIHRHL